MGKRYVLRIHRAGTPTVESVGAELAWLAALRRDTALEVPAPVPTRDGIAAHRRRRPRRARSGPLGRTSACCSAGSTGER